MFSLCNYIGPTSLVLKHPFFYKIWGAVHVTSFILFCCQCLPSKSKMVVHLHLPVTTVMVVFRPTNKTQKCGGSAWVVLHGAPASGVLLPAPGQTIKARAEFQTRTVQRAHLSFTLQDISVIELFSFSFKVIFVVVQCCSVIHLTPESPH